jgi:transposase
VAAARTALPCLVARLAGCWPMILRCWPDRRLLPRHAVRAVDHRAWLGHGPGRQLRRRGGRPGSVPGARQLYRASGLSPAQYESAGKRRDGSIGREGTGALRRALIDLGLGLWHADPAARRYGQQLRARGKKAGVIGCAMAHRANKIAYALVRDQSGYEPRRWA